ncbi:MAG: hypothetical protein HC842_05160, partial [Cytophagales bacterium]|nr:hypothetical protein [Cytophagales bacterium]
TADPFAALNTSFAQEVVYIKVKKSQSPGKPVLIHHVVDTRQAECFVSPRLLVVLEEGTQLEVVEKMDAVGQHPAWTNALTEVYLERNAQLKWTKMQVEQAECHQVSNATFRQKKTATWPIPR